MNIPFDAKALFLECFDATEKEAEIILGFASEHGKIHIKRQDGTAVNMVCRAELSDGTSYVFACCTKPEYQGRGIFKAHLDEIIGSKGAVLIPENEKLVPLYDKLGFTPIYHLEAEFIGNKTANDFRKSTDELFEIYKKSNLFPQKSKPLFEASLKAFLLYGGEINEQDGVVMLVRGGKVTEFFAESKTQAINALKNCKCGRYKVLFPLDHASVLDKEGINYEKKSIAMAKNINALHISQTYINNLFN